MHNYDQLPNESNKAYRIRLYKNKEQYGLTNVQIGDLCNKAFGVNFNESAHRKKVKNYLQGYEDAKIERCIENNSEDNEILAEIRMQRWELEKEKVKFRDERNEYKKLLREQARKESFYEMLIREVKAYSPAPRSDYSAETHALNTNTVVIHLTDIHAGIEIDNYFNTFSWEILENRINQLVSKAFEIADRHKSNKAVLICGGDIVSGVIHSNLRLENNCNVIQQTIHVSDIISNVVRQFADWFESVWFGTVGGNHDRISPDKEFCGKGEDFSGFVLPYVKSKMQNYTNVTYIENYIDDSIGCLDIEGNMVCFTHGDKDTVNNIVQNLTLMLAKKPDIVYMGHRHTNALTTIYNTKVIQSGCVSGADGYCMDKRLFNFPEQTISIINKNGLECLYDVTLN